MKSQGPQEGDIVMPREAEIVVGNGGLRKVHVHAAEAEGEIYLLGAHVTSWKPAGRQDAIWLSEKSWWEDGKPIRGGVPICFPWFGPKKDAPDAPAHGFVRLKEWQLEAVEPQDGAVTVTLSTKSDATTKNWWAADFELRYRVTFGSKLVMSLEVMNTGNSSFGAEEALHTYFAVGDVRQIHIAGLEDAHYIDKTDDRKEKKQEGKVSITAETDRVYLKTSQAVEIVDPVLRRRIRVRKENSRETVVWNPWIAKSKAMPDFGDDEWTGMVCVETCNVVTNSIEVAAQQKHRMTAVIETESL